MTIQRIQMCANIINKKHNDFSLVDLGCRTMDLKPLIKNCSSYLGTDFVSGPNVVECNLEEGLPQFETNSKDVLVALDVLEHLENCHFLIKEMLRVARKTIYISLPNMYYLGFRFRVLFRGNLSGKYSFPVEPLMDRHRWVLSFTEAVKFIEHNAQGHSVVHHKIIPIRGRTRLLIGGVEHYLGDNFPDIFAYGSLHEIALDEQSNIT